MHLCTVLLFLSLSLHLIARTQELRVLVSNGPGLEVKGVVSSLLSRLVVGGIVFFGLVCSSSHLWIDSKIKQKTMAAVYAKKLRMSVCEGGETVSPFGLCMTLTRHTEPIDVQAGTLAGLDFDDVLAKVLSKLTVK